MKGRGTYQLTTKKAIWWHRFCTCGEYWTTHLQPNGFTIVGPFNEISGPGLSDGSTDLLYAAVRGHNARFDSPATPPQ